jgi:RNA-directed DNA polymerase
MHENREISGASRSDEDRDRSAKAESHNAGAHAPEKSDCAEVPRERKQERFTALLHHLTVGLLSDSFYALKRQAAPGVDGVTWKEYEAGLEGRIADLHSRVHRGAYQAQPSRRVYIPKADGRQRPLGIAALEDKIVQQAVVTILNQIYEVDFKGFSYGFRPGRNPHQALDALAVGIQTKRVNWVLDADIRGFYDNLSHEWAMKFVERRVADRRILRLIQKWLKAGVSEDGQWSESRVGTPQGAVVTPRTQKITSSSSGGLGSGENRVQIDSCLIWLYVYGRCHAPMSPKGPSASIVRGICYGKSINSRMRSTNWPGTAAFHRAKPIATSNKLTG